MGVIGLRSFLQAHPEFAYGALIDARLTVDAGRRSASLPTPTPRGAQSSYSMAPASPSTCSECMLRAESTYLWDLTIRWQGTDEPALPRLQSVLIDASSRPYPVSVAKAVRTFCGPFKAAGFKLVVFADGNPPNAKMVHIPSVTINHSCPHRRPSWSGASRSSPCVRLCMRTLATVR